MNENDLAEMPNTQDSYEEMSEKMKAQSGKKKVFRLSLSILTGLLSLFLVFYFSLPVFQSSHIQLSHKGLLTQNDFVQLAKLERYQPMFAMDEEQVSFNAVNNSCGLILDAEIQNNGFRSSVNLTEERPCGIYDGVTYVSSGKTYDDFLTGLEQLPLSQLRKNIICSSLQEESKQHLPVLHLDKETSFDEKTASIAFRSLKSLPNSLLAKTVGFQYVNSHESSNVEFRYNIMDILVEDQGNYFLFRNNLVDQLTQLYPENKLDQLFDTLNKWTKTKQSETNALPTSEDFSFADDEENVYSAYIIKVFANEKGVFFTKA